MLAVKDELNKLLQRWKDQRDLDQSELNRSTQRLVERLQSEIDQVPSRVDSAIDQLLLEADVQHLQEGNQELMKLIQKAEQEVQSLINDSEPSAKRVKRSEEHKLDVNDILRSAASLENPRRMAMAEVEAQHVVPHANDVLTNPYFAGYFAGPNVPRIGAYSPFMSRVEGEPQPLVGLPPNLKELIAQTFGGDLQLSDQGNAGTK